VKRSTSTVISAGIFTNKLTLLILALEFLDEVWFDSMINNKSCRTLVMIAELVDSLLVIVRRRVHVEDNTEPT
jgi:hypothetical protein